MMASIAQASAWSGACFTARSRIRRTVACSVGLMRSRKLKERSTASCGVRSSSFLLRSSSLILREQNAALIGDS